MPRSGPQRAGSPRRVRHLPAVAAIVDDRVEREVPVPNPGRLAGTAGRVLPGAGPSLLVRPPTVTLPCRGVTAMLWAPSSGARGELGNVLPPQPCGGCFARLCVRDRRGVLRGVRGIEFSVDFFGPVLVFFAHPGDDGAEER